MILEGIVTSLGSQGELNVAPMGPIVDEAFSKLVLRPFRTSRTYENLKRRPYGVFHVVDDVLLLARAAIGDLPDPPEHFAAHKVPGRVLASACRWYEFEVDSCDDREERTRIEAHVVHSGRLRDVFGFNRAKHAVLEAAILATRLHLVPRAQIAADFERLRILVDKTAGPQEREAFQRLERFVESSGGSVPDEIMITTGARLHFGLFAHGQPGGLLEKGTGSEQHGEISPKTARCGVPVPLFQQAARLREFGGIGAMIERPGFVIRAVRKEGGELHCGSWQPRVEELLARLRAACGVTAAPSAIEVVRALPPHCGFGSGTQLALAIATIASTFAGESGVPAVELARRVGRGARSAVGLYGFEQGGLIVESGHREQGRISPLAARVEFPQEWRFVLVRPKDHVGISGGEEAGSFARLPGMDPQLSDRLCRIALMEILPAVTERDFEGSAESIGRFGRLVGEYFAPVQGGVFADPRLANLAERLAKGGIRGVSQTSWGPTVFILRPDESSAAALAAELARDHELAGCEVTTAAPLNQGASVENAEIRMTKE